MIPLRDTIPSRRFPAVNAAIIVLNVLVFLFEAMLSPKQLEHVIEMYGLTPAHFWQGEGLGRFVPLFTSIFMHGGWWHLISNMLVLYIFGDNVEDRLGHGRYLAFYLFSGLVASGAHMMAYARSTLPTVGASGAIAGVLGAYLMLFPNARVLTLVPFIYFVRLVEIPALIYLGFWFISQLFNGFLALAAASVLQSGVAWWAHIGGFVFGLAIVRLIAPPPPPPSPPPAYPDWYRRRWDDRGRWWWDDK